MKTVLKPMLKPTLYIGVALFFLLLTSCKKMTLKTNYVDVCVKLNDLVITNEDPETKSTATEAKVSNIVLKVFDGATAIDSVLQVSNDSDFGTLSLRLPVGSYSFVAVANTRNTPATITSTSVANIDTANNVAVYTAVQDVTIAGNTTQTVNINMGKRKNTIFQICFADAMPANVAKIKTIASPLSTLATSLDFSPITGLASSQCRYEYTFLRSDANDGTLTNKTLKLIFLLTAAEQNLDITINALSATDEILYTRTLTGVTLKQGQSTTATGTLFSPVVSGGFIFDTDIPNTDISLD